MRRMVKMPIPEFEKMPIPGFTSSELDLFSDCSSLSSPKNDSGRHERHSMEVEYAEDGENADCGSHFVYF